MITLIQKHSTFKKMLVLTMALLLTIYSNGSVAFAENTDTSKSVINYNSQIPLYDENNKVVAYYYELTNGGYLITDATGSNFIEYSTEKSSSFLEKGKTYYYGGPLAYYEKSANNKNSLTDCKSEQTIQTSEFDSKLEASVTGNSEKHTTLSKKATAEAIEPMLKHGTVDKSLTYPTYSYDYNLNGTCGSVAAAIVLMYYHDYVVENFVPSKYVPTDNSGKTLVNYLIPFIEQGSSGSTYSSVKSGLTKYLSTNSINSSVVAYNPGPNSSKTLERIKTIIDNNKPGMVGILGHPSYQDHWVVATGYSTESVTDNTVTGTENTENTENTMGTDTSLKVPPTTGTDTTPKIPTTGTDTSLDDEDSANTDLSLDDEDSADSDLSLDDEDSADADLSLDDEDSADADLSLDDEDSADADMSVEEENSGVTEIPIEEESSEDSGSSLNWISNLFDGGDSSSSASSISENWGSTFKNILGIIGSISSIFSKSSDNADSSTFNSVKHEPDDKYPNAVTGSALSGTVTGSAVDEPVNQPVTGSSVTGTVTDDTLDDTAVDNTATGDADSEDLITSNNAKYGTDAIIVNDGWGAQNVRISLKYVDGVVYLK